MKKFIASFTEQIENGEQKVAYVSIDGTIYVIRHDYIIGTPVEEVDAVLNAKIDAYEPSVAKFS